MSGIIGVVDFGTSRIDPESLRNIAESSSYRAPGGTKYLFLNEAGLVYQALQAPAAGEALDQPLLDARNQICVILDGRLDNRSELIDRLGPAEGRSASDVRLLLAAYLEWGIECADHLLGDFAFAVWDAPRRRLLCAVDALGIKPFHYAQVGSLVCFASDAIQVLLHPAVPDEYNEREIAAFLGYQCEDPKRSFFEAINKLAPGHRLTAESGVVQVKSYWVPQLEEIRYVRDEDYAAHFLQIFQRSVSDRLRDPGSFAGVAMSGGLDSTSVAALAHQMSPATRTYTFFFDRLTECDERAYSGAMTEELGLEVEPVEAERHWSLESRVALPFSPDTPSLGWRGCFEEIHRAMAARGARVLLTGHGGDDLLRGSPLVYAERLQRGDLAVIRDVVLYARSRRESVFRLLYRYLGRPHVPTGFHRRLSSALGKRQVSLSSLIHPNFLLRTQQEEFPAGTLRQRVFASPARQEIYDNLVESPWYLRIANWHDRSSAPSGAEVRHPFLDRRLFEYILAVPVEQIFRLGFTKNLLRRAMSGILPEKVRLRRGKTSFTRFLDHLLLERATDEVLELVRAPRSAEFGILDGERLRSAYRGLANGGSEASRGAVWRAICLEIWLRRCDAIRSQGARTGKAAA